MSDKNQTNPDPVQLAKKAIQQVLNSVQQNPDPKSFDERIAKNIDLFLSIDEFFKLPTSLIGRVLKISNKILTPQEANRALRLHIKYNGSAGLGLIMHLDIGNVSGGEALEALRGLDDVPIIHQLCTQQFLGPPPEKSLRVQDLEEQNEKLKKTILAQNKRYMEQKMQAEELQKDLKKLEAYKKRNPDWPREYKILTEKYKEVEQFNEQLQKENEKWKNAAFTKPLLKPKNFIDNIFRAIDKNDYASVEYLVESTPSLVNATEDGDLLETWTPLLLACKHGHLAIVKLLVEHGADVNRREPHGTPLSYASKTGQEVEKYLIEHGATRE